MPQNPSLHHLSAEILKISPMAVLVRVYPERRRITHLFAANFLRVPLDRTLEERAGRLVRNAYGDAPDWGFPHDFHVPTGILYLTPDPHRTGYIPQEDHSFGMSPARRIVICEDGAR